MDTHEPLEIRTDPQRLNSQLTELAAFSDAPAPAVTRVVYISARKSKGGGSPSRVKDAGLTETGWMEGEDAPISSG